MQQMREVKVSNASGYTPQTLIIQRGDSVIWLNTESVASGIQHRPVPDDSTLTWVASNIPPDSPSPQANFAAVGDFPYHDGVNPALKAKIVVAQGVVIGQNGDATAFVPASVSIKKGQSVTWANETPMPLQPTPDTGAAWFNQPIASGAISAPVRFDTAGTFPYHCIVPGKPNVKGTIKVS